jgi:hypothetical protein
MIAGMDRIPDNYNVCCWSFPYMYVRISC